MRKVLIAVVSAFSYLLVTASVALAEGGSTLPSPGGNQVRGNVVRPPDATAFTGADLGIWLVAAAALVVIGAVLVIAGRRRATVS